MDATLINPFIESVVSNLEKIAGITPHKEKISLHKIAGESADITCVIGFSGELLGSAVISYPKALALKIASAFFMEKLTEFNHDAIDAIGEIGNIIIGHARNGLVNDGKKLTISTPVIIKGPDVKISAPKGSLFLVVSFKTSRGNFSISVNIRRN